MSLVKLTAEQTAEAANEQTEGLSVKTVETAAEITEKQPDESNADQAKETDSDEKENTVTLDKTEIQ